MRLGRDTPVAQTTATARGVGMLAAGATLTALGIGTASGPLVIVGAATGLASALSLAWLAVGATLARRVLTRVKRDIAPAHLTVGEEAEVTVTIDSPGPLLQGMGLREQAAAELTGESGTRAGVQRSPRAIRLRYRLTPTVRGRWPLGPAIARVSDPLGMGWTERQVGEIVDVAVWPRVTDLAHSAGRLMGMAERSSRGAHQAAQDDAALREYRDGDDLRRVHWASSARRGSLVVRSEEQAGRATATVLTTLSPDADTLEWCISASASIALSVLTAGHPVQFVAQGARTMAESPGRDLGAARAAVLDATLDLGVADAPRAMEAQLAEDVSHLRLGERDVMIAVLEPLGAAGLEVLAPLGASGRSFAVVRCTAADRADAERTARALAASGWQATVVEEAEGLESGWERLLSQGAAR